MTLCFAYQLITLKGRHRRDPRAGKADYAQFFDAKRWPAQPDGKPVITWMNMKKAEEGRRPQQKVTLQDTPASHFFSNRHKTPICKR